MVGITAVWTGAIVDMSGGASFWSLTSETWIVVGLALFTFFGGVLIIWTEHGVAAADILYGNSSLRSLWMDGIPPFRDEYLRYLRQGDLAVVRRFRDGGMIDFRGEHNNMPLHAAINSDNPLIVQGLIERGVHVDSRNG